MKKSLLLIACIFAFFAAKAQDQAIFSHYHISPVLVNPGATGFSEKNNLMMNIRSQWAGFTGAPKTYALSYNGPIGRTMGIGAGLLSENIASLTRLRFQLNYAFRYQINDVKIGMGFSTEFSKQRLAGSVVNNPLIEVADRLLMESVDGISIFDATLGFYGTIRDKTSIGLSFPNMIVARLGEDAAGSEPAGNFFKYYIFNVGRKMDFEGAGVSFEPSIMIRKTLETPFQIDFNTLAGFLSDQLYAGLSYRAGSGGALGILLGGKVSGVKLFYSFDIGFSKFQEYNNGSHEITAAFEFSKWNKTEYDTKKKF